MLEKRPPGPIISRPTLFEQAFRKPALLMLPSTFSAWPAATQVVSGSGATIVAEDEVNLSTGTTHASTAGRRRAAMLPHTATVNFGINWGKKLILSFFVQWTGATATNLTMRFLLTQSTAIENLAAHGLGWQTNGANMNLVTYGANGSLATVSAATNILITDRAHILIVHDPTTSVRMYINGVLVATQSTAGDIPSTQPNVDYQWFASIARSGGADVGDEALNVEALVPWQES